MGKTIIVTVKTCQQEAQTVSYKYGMVNCKLWYAYKKMTPAFGTFFTNVFTAHLCHKSEASSINRKASSEGFFFKEVEGFFRRALGSYTHKFLKHRAASLTDLLELCLCLPESNDRKVHIFWRRQSGSQKGPWYQMGAA